MKYVRTETGIYEVKEEALLPMGDEIFYTTTNGLYFYSYDILKQADTIEELIEIGDIVFYWLSSDDKEHCGMVSYDTEQQLIKHSVLTKLVIPVGEDYKGVAKGQPFI